MANPSQARVAQAQATNQTPEFPRFKFPTSMLKRFPELAKAVEEHNQKLVEWQRKNTFANS